MLIVFGYSEDVGTDAAKMILKVEAEGFVFADHRVIDHGEVAKEFEFVFLREGGAAFFVVPKDIIGSKAHGEVVTEGAGFAEELNMTGVDDIVTTGDKYFFHRNRIN